MVKSAEELQGNRLSKPLPVSISSHVDVREEVAVLTLQTGIEGHQATGRLADDLHTPADRILKERVAHEFLSGRSLDMLRQALAPFDDVQQQVFNGWPAIAVRHQSGRASPYTDELETSTKRTVIKPCGHSITLSFMWGARVHYCYLASGHEGQHAAPQEGAPDVRWGLDTRTYEEAREGLPL